jgi:hypothetical protein
LPAVLGTAIVVLALPLFLLAGWPLEGWAVGALLWVGFEALGWFTARIHTRTGNLAAAGMAGFLMLFRAIIVMVVVLALLVSDQAAGVAALLTYAAAFSAQLGLSLVAYYTGPEAGHKVLR